MLRLSLSSSYWPNRLFKNKNKGTLNPTTPIDITAVLLKNNEAINLIWLAVLKQILILADKIIIKIVKTTK